MPSPSGSNHHGTWGFPSVSGLDAAGMPGCTTLPAIAARITADRQNRCPEQPPHARALCYGLLLADLTEGKRHRSSEARPFETKEIIARPRLSTRILDSCARLPTAIVPWQLPSKVINANHWNSSPQGRTRKELMLSSRNDH
jgi:hypothetical protein